MTDDRKRARERRRARRGPLLASLRWSIGKLRGEGQLLDVSPAGLRISSTRPVRLYSRIELWLPLPAHVAGEDSQVFELQGVVVWVQGDQAGVSLIDPPDEVQARLEALVEDRGQA